MSVLALGLNHTTAAVDLRGRFAFAVDQLSPALRTLHTRLAGGQNTPHAPEAALLSTCNRTELYCAAPALSGSPHVLQREADGGDAGPAAKAQDDGLSAGLYQLDDVGAKADGSHGQDNEEPAQLLER